MRTRLWLMSLVLAFRVYGQNGAPTPLVSVDKSSPMISRNLISKKELLVPRKAVKELLRSQRDYALGNVRASAGHLENALRLYPDYMEARNNLGAEYIELREYEKAISELRTAAQIDPSAVQPLNNLVVAFLFVQRYPDAEATARRALVLDPQNSRSRFLLGCTLATEKRNTREAVEMLNTTKNEFPESRLLLAQILLRQGGVEEAKRELQDYLSVPGIEKTALVEGWLAQLTRASKSLKSQARAEPSTQ